MDISLDFYQGSLFTCTRCGAAQAPCGYEDELWFHENFFRYPTYLHARVPRIECCQGVVAAERPWSRAGSKFGRLAQAQEGAGERGPELPYPAPDRGAAERWRWRPPFRDR